MIADARAVYEYFRQLLNSNGFSGSRFVKGRSMGCHSAVEVAARFQDELSGLISESGSAAAERTAVRWGLSLESPGMRETLRLHKEKLESITLPYLAIHGEWDELIPVETAMELHDTLASRDKSVEIIPQAGHNDLLWVGRDQYFQAMQRFLAEHGGGGQG